MTILYELLPWLILGFIGVFIIVYAVIKATSTKTTPILKPQIESADVIQAPVAPAISWKQRLVLGLQKTHGQLFNALENIFTSTAEKNSRENNLTIIFEALIQADVGYNTSEILVNKVKEHLTNENATNATYIRNILKTEILNLLQPNSSTNEANTIEKSNYKPHIVLMVGVNGVGKTTTAGKLAFKAHQKNMKAIIGAADTFRAAAVEQLRIWCARSEASLIELKDGSDPSSVAFETVKKARADNYDLCIVDTAGRLHNRQDLMQELSKIKRVMGKEDQTAPHEVLLVLDATTGQNALQQAKTFREVVNITGIVLTKLDGTAKGGIALAIVNELKIPIRYIGVGETAEDLELFNPQEFVDALFAE